MADFRYVVDTENYDEVLAFYRDACGFPVTRAWDEWEDKGAGASRGRGSVLRAADGVMEVRDRPAGLLVAVEVEDVDAQYERLKASGAEVLSEPATMPWGHRHF